MICNQVTAIYVCMVFIDLFLYCPSTSSPIKSAARSSSLLINRRQVSMHRYYTICMWCNHLSMCNVKQFYIVMDPFMKEQNPIAVA